MKKSRSFHYTSTESLAFSVEHLHTQLGRPVAVTVALCPEREELQESWNSVPGPTMRTGRKTLNCMSPKNITMSCKDGVQDDINESEGFASKG